MAIAEQLRQAQADLAQARQQRSRRRNAEQAAARHRPRAAEQARQQAEQETRNAEQAVHARVESEERNEALQRRHDLLQGSLRTFLRGYLPRLRRHLFGQRP